MAEIKHLSVGFPLPAQVLDKIDSFGFSEGPPETAAQPDSAVPPAGQLVNCMTQGSALAPFI